MQSVLQTSMGEHLQSPHPCCRRGFSCCKIAWRHCTPWCWEAFPRNSNAVCHALTISAVSTLLSSISWIAATIGIAASNQKVCSCFALLQALIVSFGRVDATTGCSSGHLVHLESGFPCFCTRLLCVAASSCLTKTVSRKAFPASDTWNSVLPSSSEASSSSSSRSFLCPRPHHGNQSCDRVSSVLCLSDSQRSRDS